MGTADLANSSITVAKLSPGLAGTVAIDPPDISGNTCTVVSVTVTAIQAGDYAIVMSPNTLDNQLIGTAATQDAVDTLKVRFCNTSDSSRDGASLSWTYLIFR